jgi:hypothetical protein
MYPRAWTLSGFSDEANEVAVLAKHRDYSFDEWVALTPEGKFEILLHYWKPKRPELGEET